MLSTDTVAWRGGSGGQAEGEEQHHKLPSTLGSFEPNHKEGSALTGLLKDLIKNIIKM